jgi:glycosyltransferase involved in cell wall biosynthesis
VVHTFHGFPFHPFQSRLRRAAYVALERKLGRITDRFVAVSSGVAAEAVRRRIAPPDRIRVIPVSISAAPAGGPGARARARRLLGFPDHATLLGSVGRLDHQKAPGDFLRAVAALPRRVQAVWIGGGPLRRQVEAERRRLGLQDRVRLLGERDDVGELLPGLDVFLMTSLYEGLPCALLEAMAAGVPVVATAVNGVPEAVVAGVTGLLAPPADPAACAHAVRHLLDHPADAERMAAAARQAVAGRFTPAAAGAALEWLYLDALGAESAALEPVPRAS